MVLKEKYTPLVFHDSLKVFCSHGFNDSSSSQSNSLILNLSSKLLHSMLVKYDKVEELSMTLHATGEVFS